MAIPEEKLDEKFDFEKKVKKRDSANSQNLASPFFALTYVEETLDVQGTRPCREKAVQLRRTGQSRRCLGYFLFKNRIHNLSYNHSVANMTAQPLFQESPRIR